MSKEQFDRIETYLQGTLPEYDKQVFEAELRTNAALRSEMETQQKLRLGLRALAIEKKLTAARKRTQSPSTAPVAHALIPFQAWRIAATVLIVVGIGWGVWHYQLSAKDEQLAQLAEQQMVDTQYKAMPLDSLEKLTLTAQSAIAREKAEWYIALVYLKKGKKKEARGVLTKIVENPQHAYYQKAKKLLARDF